MLSDGVWADIIASVMDAQPPLPQGLDGGASILQYVEFMMGRNQQQQQIEQYEAAADPPEVSDAVAAYMKGGVAAWQPHPSPAFDEAIERTMMLYVMCDV
jgi:hypothetical protein